MRAPKARAKIFIEIIKTSLVIQIHFKGNQTKKSYNLHFVSLIHNGITWCVLDFLQKGRDSLILPDLEIDCEIPRFSLTLPTCIVHFISKKLIDQVKRNKYFQKNIKKMWKVGRTNFEKVRPKANQCAMTGALFSKKCARANFSAPFAQWRSPNASLR